MSEANTAAPAASEEERAFQENWNAFMNSSFDIDDNGEFIDTGASSGESTTAAASGDDTLQGGAGNDQITTQPEGQDSAAAPASSDAPLEGAPGEDVDPALLAAMAGLATAPKPASEPAAPAASGTSADGNKPDAGSSEDDDDAPFMPFQPTFKLDKALSEALFESDDVATREKALVGLLSAFGNTVIAVAEQRIREHHVPRLQEATLSQFQQVQVSRAVQQDFYAAFPELSEYKPAVVKAMEVIQNQNPGAPYTEELRNKVGALARAALTQAGVKLPARPGTQPASSAAPAPAPSPAPAADVPFEAGGARPAMSGGDNGPADILEQLSQF